MAGRFKTIDDYKNQAKVKHNNLYDYSLWLSYEPSATNYHKKIPILCPIHGKFEQSLANHLRGSKCPFCKHTTIASKNRKGKQFFINKAIDIHSDEYDYSLWAEVLNTSTDVVKIICKTHGIFEQTPASHINKKAGCPLCKEAHKSDTCIRNVGVKHHMQKHIATILSLIDNPEWLYDQHITQKKPIIQIAVEFGLSDSTLGRYFKKHKIKVTHTRGRSHKSIKWLESVMNSERIYIQHYENDGEYSIPNTPYRADGYCAETNTIYEFHGDYWHGNPDVYDPTCYNKALYKTMNTLYQATISREYNIRELGYNLVVMWESEFNKI